jgi:hypothetical protein
MYRGGTLGELTQKQVILVVVEIKNDGSRLCENKLANSQEDKPNYK